MQIQCTCLVCGRLFHIPAFEARQGRGLYCSRPCSQEAQRRAMAASRIDRIRARLRRVGDCLFWTGARTSNGYGYVKVAGRRVPVHRLVWEHENGTIPEGLWVLHRCDNPPCCDPSHLFLGTPADNTADMWGKGRSATQKGTIRFPQGSAAHLAKLTEADVAAIRHAYATGETQVALAQRFGVNQTTISTIVLRKTWKHVA